MYTTAKNGRRVGCPGLAQGRLLWAVYDAARAALKTMDGLVVSAARFEREERAVARLRGTVNAVAADELARRTEARAAKPRVAPKRRRRVR
jgi:hypothetical protein